MPRGESREALEQFPEERRIFISDGRSDVVGGTVVGFQLPFCCFDAKILDVVDDCGSGCGSEPPLQAALGNAARGDDGGHGTRLGEMVRQPVLGLPNDGVGVRLPPDKARIRQLAVTMPLEEVKLGDVQRLSRTADAK